MTNMSGMENLTSIGKLVLGVNTATDGVAGILVLVSLFVVVLVGLIRNNPPQEALLASGAVTTLASLLTLAMGLTGIEWTVGFGLVFALSAIALYMNK